MDENQNQPKDNPYLFPQHPHEPEQSPRDPLNDTSDPFTTKLKDNRHWWEKLRKKDWIIIGVVILLLGGGLGAFMFLNREDEKPATPAPTARKTATGQPIVSALTGIPVTQADRQRPVTAVMVENSPAARPQSGLKEAGIVFEAIAEYGITRFMALYQEAQPANIGPIRSARLYYVNWAQGYDAAYAHVGGSPEALRYIKSASVKDLDQSFNGGYYQRIASRQAPHNVYTSMAKLNELEKAKGWFTEPNFTGFGRKKDEAAKQPNANAIDISISSSAYHVHYDYDKATNTYKRSMGGAPHLDAESKTQLTPKTVVTLAVPYRIQADGYHSEYTTVGSGQATVFQDGIAIGATWTKSSVTDRIILKDAQGKELKLNAGQTWITVVGSPNAVVAKP